MRARETASFWRENVIAVAILRRDLARMLWWRKQVHQIFRGFIILLSVEGLTSFNRDKSAISLVKKKMKLSGVSYLRIREKTLRKISSSNLKVCNKSRGADHLI